jgi:hypothetical protein
MKRAEQRSLVRARLSAALVCILSGALLAPRPALSEEPQQLVGAYTQISAEGEYTTIRSRGIDHALVAFAAIHQVSGAPEHREMFEVLLDHILDRDPDYMGHLFGVQVLDDPFLRSHPLLMDNVRGYANELVDSYERAPENFLYDGDIRTLTGIANFLVTYADFLEADISGRRADPSSSVRKLVAVDRVARALLDRTTDLQFTMHDAVTRFNNPRLVGGFPHLIDEGDGSMGAWDVEGWSPAMLSIEQYAALEALANGYGRYQTVRYERAAAAATRPLLSSTEVAPNLIYAGAPPGFPLDGAEFLFAEETGEHIYVISYGWSPNAIGQLGSALRAVVDNRVSVAASDDWAEQYWKGPPPEWTQDDGKFWANLEAKIVYTHDFLEATQLPVPESFPWLGLERTSYAGTGDDDVRRDGWYDGSGRGQMSTVYSRIAMAGYVASGGDNVAIASRAANWWERMLVWEEGSSASAAR